MRTDAVNSKRSAIGTGLRRLVQWAAVLAAACGGTPRAGSAPARPNVLVVLCDDLRWDCLGCAGHPHLRTPNIDRLAAEGVWFRNAFCTTSLCSPSRASILSGRYAHTHRVFDNFTELPDALPTFPKALQAAGYETAYIGKWHMGEDNDAKRPGFDYWVSHRGQGKYYGTEFNIDGRREARPGYYTTEVTHFAVDWLRRPHARPWMLMLGHKAPHSFYIPEPKYSNVFDRVRIDYPDTAFHLEGKPEWIRQRLRTWHGIYGPLFDWRKKFPDDRPEAVKDFAAMTRAYWGVIQSVDDSMGGVVRTLEGLGQLDRTIVLFLGDNGLLNGEHGMVDKRTMHEPSIRIPMVARYPGLVPTNRATAVDKLVLTIDVAPSLLDLCGLPPLPGAQGRSWVGLARGEAPAWRRQFLYEYNYEKQFPYTPNVRGLRTEEWAFMRYPTGDGGPDRHLAEMYDLRQDPEERHNLINAPACQGVRRDLETRLEKAMEETGLRADDLPLDEGIKSELPDQKVR